MYKIDTNAKLQITTTLTQQHNVAPSSLCRKLIYCVSGDLISIDIAGPLLNSNFDVLIAKVYLLLSDEGSSLTIGNLTRLPLVVKYFGIVIIFRRKMLKEYLLKDFCGKCRGNLVLGA